MRDVITFLTSKEIIVVYIVAGIACFLAFIIYLVDKNYDKRKQRHNTKELNKLVEEVSEVIKEENISYNEPILEPVIKEEAPSVIESKPLVNEVEILDENKSSVAEPVITTTVAVENNANSYTSDTATPVVSEVINTVPTENNIVLENLNRLEEDKKQMDFESKLQEPVRNDDELQYTTIEPNPEQAREELKKLAEELEVEEQQIAENPQTIITNYEEQQESNAIISLEELVRKSKEMYANNELNQYKDEGNEPISLTDLEVAKEENNKPYYNEPFIIANAVSDMEKLINKPVQIEQLQMDDFDTVNSNPVVESVTPTIVQKPTIITNSSTSVEVMNNNETTPQQVQAKPKVEDLYQVSAFKKSPVISPIYGIERSEDDYLELENTANYDKLDEEIRKTNEFLMTLKELQKNLD